MPFSFFASVLIFFICNKIKGFSALALLRVDHGANGKVTRDECHVTGTPLKFSSWVGLVSELDHVLFVLHGVTFFYANL